MACPGCGSTYGSELLPCNDCLRKRAATDSERTNPDRLHLSYSSRIDDERPEGFVHNFKNLIKLFLFVALLLFAFQAFTGKRFVNSAQYLMADMAGVSNSSERPSFFKRHGWSSMSLSQISEEKRSIVGTAVVLAAIGVILAAFTWLWILALAMNDSFAWVPAILVCPPTLYVYCLFHTNRAFKPLVWNLLGMISLIGALSIWIRYIQHIS